MFVFRNPQVYIINICWIQRQKTVFLGHPVYTHLKVCIYLYESKTSRINALLPTGESVVQLESSKYWCFKT